MDDVDESETIAIKRTEYEKLKRASRKLAALEAGGVDNWEWYGDSLEDYFKEEDE